MNEIDDHSIKCLEFLQAAFMLNRKEIDKKIEEQSDWLKKQTVQSLLTPETFSDIPITKKVRRIYSFKHLNRGLLAVNSLLQKPILTKTARIIALDRII